MEYNIKNNINLRKKSEPVTKSFESTKEIFDYYKNNLKNVKTENLSESYKEISETSKKRIITKTKGKSLESIALERLSKPTQTFVTVYNQEHRKLAYMTPIGRYDGKKNFLANTKYFQSEFQQSPFIVKKKNQILNKKIQDIIRNNFREKAYNANYDEGSVNNLDKEKNWKNKKIIKVFENGEIVEKQIIPVKKNEISNENDNNKKKIQNYQEIINTLENEENTLRTNENYLPTNESVFEINDNNENNNNYIEENLKVVEEILNSNEMERKNEINENIMEEFRELNEEKNKNSEEVQTKLKEFLRNNKDYFLHLLGKCKCFRCKCGKCKCNYISRKLPYINLASNYSSSYNDYKSNLRKKIQELSTNLKTKSQTEPDTSHLGKEILIHETTNNVDFF